MKPIRRSPAPLVALILLAFTVGGQAAPITKKEIRQDLHGSVISRLYSSFELQATAARRWYADALRGRRVNTQQFRRFSVELERATFVSFTYTYRVGDEQRSRVYHSRSGHNNPWAQRGRPNPSPRRDELRNSARVEDYYLPQTVATVALDQPALADSHVTESPVPNDYFPDQRKRDAELKVVRQLESDIRQGRVEPNGTLQGFSSQVPCASCEAALTAFSDNNHHIPVHVTYLGRNSQAYGQFHNMRQQFVSSVEVSVNGGQTNLLNEEAGPSGAARIGSACVDDSRQPDPRPR